MSNEDIRNKIHNVELIVADIKKMPQTYKTMLGELCKDGTCQFVLRRKLNNLISDGTICKTTIPNTRFGEIVFYTLPKDYYILIENDRIGCNVYCFFEYKQVSRYYISADEWWLLKDGVWHENKEPKAFFEGRVLKFI